LGCGGGLIPFDPKRTTKNERWGVKKATKEENRQKKGRKRETTDRAKLVEAEKNRKKEGKKKNGR